MEPVRKLILNYKNQIDYLMDIDQIVKGSRGSKDIEKITTGLHESQNLIECIMELNVQREAIEVEIAKVYSLKEFDVIQLSLSIENDLSRELMATFYELIDMTAIVLEGKKNDVQELKESIHYTKNKYNETVKGQFAYHGYKKRIYDAFFINRVSE